MARKKELFVSMISQEKKKLGQQTLMAYGLITN